MQIDEKLKHWLAIVTAIHGDKYDYSEVKYINSKTPVTVICKTHGAWNCIPHTHASKTLKRGCPVCGGSQVKTTEQFIRDANFKHHGVYDYTQARYINSHTNLVIVCRRHGAFNQSPTSHLAGKGCPQCSKLKRQETERTKSLALIEAKLLENTGGAVQIIAVSFLKVNAVANFICQRHGEFTRIVNAAIYNRNACPECFKENNISNRRNQIDAELNLAKYIKDGFTYEPFFYKGAKKTSITLNCTKHGKWSVLYASVISNGANCPKCVQAVASPKRTASIKIKNLEKQKLYWENYLIKFKERHGDTYDYSLASFINAKAPIKIKCSVHGVFEQPPDTHIKSGCRMCADDELAGLYSKRFFELKPQLADVPARLYLLRLNWGSGSCFKIGITRTTLKRRFGAALGKGIKIDVLRIAETSLLSAWKYEVMFLSLRSLKKFDAIDKDFARDARISPSELFSNLPDGWEQLTPWTTTVPYQLS
jgi:hypothetical protein